MSPFRFRPRVGPFIWTPGPRRGSLTRDLVLLATVVIILGLFALVSLIS